MARKERKVSVVLRFCRYDVEELDQLIKSNWGPLPRSLVINEAVGHFLYHANGQQLEMCKKRRVNIILNRKRLDQLNEFAELHGLNRADIIRYAIRKVVPMFADEDRIESF